MRKDKVHDIARGVLPSTSRKSARDNKRNFHKKQRAAQREVIHGARQHLTFVDERTGRIAHDPDLYDDFEARDIVDGYHASTKKDGSTWDDDMSYIVARRRDADKLGPLIRWAEAIEKRDMVGWEGPDKYAYFKAVLPDTLQGRHALGHVETALRLDNDIFWRYFTPYEPTTKVDFRNALDRCLATKAGRRSLRTFVTENVPVAAHATQSNNGHVRREQARDENGLLRYHPQSPEEKALGVFVPVMVEVWAPQIISVTCGDCSFLRNDPLATPEAVARFAEIVWDGRFRYNTYGRRMSYDANPHHFCHEIIKHVLTF